MNMISSATPKADDDDIHSVQKRCTFLILFGYFHQNELPVAGLVPKISTQVFQVEGGLAIFVAASF